MTDPDLTDPATYERWLVERVRFSDTDLLGHVNNVAIAAYVESGRVDYGIGTAVRAGGAEIGVTLRRVEIDFLAELHYPAQLDVGTRLLGVGRTSFTLGTGVFDRGRCVATSKGVLVSVGPDGPLPMDADVRAALEARLP